MACFRGVACGLLLACGTDVCLAGAKAADTEQASGAIAVAGPGPEELVVQAPEPRYAAPTRRDAIGRVWAPVYIDEQGPFRLVLDTGASRSSIAGSVARTLGLAPDHLQSVLLRGVTGVTEVPTVRAQRLTVGDLTLQPVSLPILLDPLGGADGVLGAESLGDRRIYIDFIHDMVQITRSHGERPGAGFAVIPFRGSDHGLIVVRARIAGLSVQAIIDTGAQVTIGNMALRSALRQTNGRGALSAVSDVTATSWEVEALASPPIELGQVRVRGSTIVYGDMPIFKHWQMASEPALLIGMDVLGLLDVLVIDYPQRVLYLQVRGP